MHTSELRLARLCTPLPFSQSPPLTAPAPTPPRSHARPLTLSVAHTHTHTHTHPRTLPRRIQAVGFGIGAIIAMPVLGCPGMTDPDNATLRDAPLVLAIAIAVYVAYKGCMHGYRRGMRLVSPKLHHSSLVMTGASNWVTITYTIPKKPFGCLSKCLGEDKAKPDLATIVLPLERPTAFIDQAQRQKWVAGGLESSYVERRDDVPYGDATHTMYSFNASVEERTLAPLQHGAADIESSQPLVPQTPRTETGAETIALTYKQYLKLFETRKEELAIIRDKGEAVGAAWSSKAGQRRARARRW